MITKNDCLMLLIDLKDLYPDKKEEIDANIKKLLVATSPSLEIIKFINDNKELSLRAFYEKLRKSYNSGNKNIVNESELEPKELLCCLGALQQQILLYNKFLESDVTFLKHARFGDISKCLLNYYTTGDIVPCQKLLNLFKSDLKLLEEISK